MLERRKGGLLFKHKKKTLAASMGMGQGGSTPINAFIDQATFLLPLSDAGAGAVNLTPLKAGSATPTFTRATTATTVLSNGLIGSVSSGVARSYYEPSSYVTNLFQYSDDFDGSDWVPFNLNAFGAGSVIDAIPGPSSGMFGTYLQEAVTASIDHRISQAQVKAAFATTFTVSIYAKVAQRFHLMIRLQDSTTTANRVDATFNLNAGTTNGGTAVGTYTGASSTITPVGNGWYRLTATCTTDAVANNLTVRIFLGNDLGSFTYVGDGVSGLYVSGAQLEQAATAGPYIATVASEVTRAQTYMGYLAEGQRTNLCLRSEDLSTGWTPSETTVTADNTTSPDGTVNADKLVASTNNTAHLLATPSWTSTLAPYTFAIFLKAGEYTTARLGVSTSHITGTGANANFDLVAGTATPTNDCTASIKAYPNGWYRCAITFTPTAVAAASSFVYVGTGSFAGTGTSGIYAWGGQIELGSFASSYIPTAGSTVTRNADVLTYPFAGNADQTVGTWYGELTTEWAAGNLSTNYIACSFAAGNTGPISSGFGTPIDTQIFIRDGTNAIGKNSTPATSTGVRKTASSWGSAGMSITRSGLTPTTGAFDGALANTAIGIGQEGSGGFGNWFGTIKNVRIWSQQAPDIMLMSLTAS